MNKLQQVLIQSYNVSSVSVRPSKRVLEGLSRNSLVLSDIELSVEEIFPFCRFLESKAAIAKLQILLLSSTPGPGELKHRRCFVNVPPGKHSIFSQLDLKLMKSILQFIAKSKNLHTIIIDSVNISPEFSVLFGRAIGITASPLQWLSLKYVNLGDDGLRALTHSLSTLHLQVLVLENCGLTDVSCNYLATVIKTQEAQLDNLFWNTTLRASPSKVSVSESDYFNGLLVLSVRGNRIKGPGLVTFGKILSKATWLLALDLADNCIEEKALISFMDGVSASEFFRVFLLHGNRGFTDEPAAIALQQLKKPLAERFRNLPESITIVLQRWTHALNRHLSDPLLKKQGLLFSSNHQKTGTPITPTIVKPEPAPSKKKEKITKRSARPHKHAVEVTSVEENPYHRPVDRKSSGAPQAHAHAHAMFLANAHHAHENDHNPLGRRQSQYRGDPDGHDDAEDFGLEESDAIAALEALEASADQEDASDPDLDLHSDNGYFEGMPLSSSRNSNSHRYGARSGSGDAIDEAEDSENDEAPRIAGAPNPRHPRPFHRRVTPAHLDDFEKFGDISLITDDPIFNQPSAGVAQSSAWSAYNDDRPPSRQSIRPSSAGVISSQVWTEGSTRAGPKSPSMASLTSQNMSASSMGRRTRSKSVELSRPSSSPGHPKTRAKSADRSLFLSSQLASPSEGQRSKDEVWSPHGHEGRLPLNRRAGEVLQQVLSPRQIKILRAQQEAHHHAAMGDLRPSSNTRGERTRPSAPKSVPMHSKSTEILRPKQEAKIKAKPKLPSQTKPKKISPSKKKKAHPTENDVGATDAAAEISESMKLFTQQIESVSHHLRVVCEEFTSTIRQVSHNISMSASLVGTPSPASAPTNRSRSGSRFTGTPDSGIAGFVHEADYPRSSFPVSEVPRARTPIQVPSPHSEAVSSITGVADGPGDSSIAAVAPPTGISNLVDRSQIDDAAVVQQLRDSLQSKLIALYRKS